MTENQFVTSQIVDNNYITTSKTINLSGGQFLYSGINFWFPIVKNKFTVNLNYSPGFGKSQAIVNDIKNITNTLRNRISLRVNITPKEQFSCYLNSSFSMNDTKYNINTSQNQRIIEQSYSLELNAKLFWGIYSNNSFKYSILLFVFVDQFSSKFVQTTASKSVFFIQFFISSWVAVCLTFKMS